MGGKLSKSSERCRYQGQGRSVCDRESSAMGKGWFFLWNYPIGFENFDLKIHFPFSQKTSGKICITFPSKRKIFHIGPVAFGVVRHN
ncbi:MAG: hypothetical protein LBT64_03295 [Puniceicoccales bacterium]|jgi:hypothetical protein|nr:hypothetical protein [Puniceicoccales bacterium]